MKKTIIRRMLSFVLLLSLLLSPVLTGCKKKREPVSDLYVVLSREADETTLSAFYTLESRLRACGYTVHRVQDSYSVGETPVEIPKGAYQICLGATNRPESRCDNQVGWSILAEDELLVIKASHAIYLNAALERLHSSLFADRTDPFGKIENWSRLSGDFVYLGRDGMLDISIQWGESGGEKAAAEAFAGRMGRLIQKYDRTKQEQLYEGALPVHFIIDPTLSYNSCSLAHLTDGLKISAPDADTLLKAAEGLQELLQALCTTENGEARSLCFPEWLSIKDVQVDPSLPTLPSLDAAPVFTGYLYPTSYTVAKESGTQEQFAQYAAQLEADGYQLQSSRSYSYDYLSADLFNSKKGNGQRNSFRLYQKGNYSVYLYYCSGNGNIRVVASTAQMADQYKEINASVATGDVTPMFAMLDIGGQNANPDWIYNQGLCLAFRLSDGRFIIVDGGQWSDADASATEVTRLYNWLVEHSPNGQVVIAAWLFTHAHSDHVNIAWKLEQMYGEVTIEYYMHNFPSLAYTQSLSKSDINLDYYSTKYPRTEAWLAEYPMIIPHTGMVYQFADCTVEILYTQEDFFPREINDFNNSCTVYKITQGGKSFLIAGDLEEPGQEHMITQTGTHLESDYVQVTHHGYNGLKQFYMYGIGNTPTTGLWPQPKLSMEELRDRKHTAVADVNRYFMDRATENYSTNEGSYVIELPRP